MYFLVVVVNVNCNLVFMLIFVIFNEIVLVIWFVGIFVLLCNIKGILFVILFIVFNMLKFKFF